MTFLRPQKEPNITIVSAPLFNSITIDLVDNEAVVENKTITIPEVNIPKVNAYKYTIELTYHYIWSEKPERESEFKNKLICYYIIDFKYKN